ncbi:hypothetical protein MMC27_007077 [Xylographa pallens]|nr:hypothetical protein [Xylographa pallens]
MSSLRRRFLGESSAEPSRDVTPEKDEEVRLIPLSKLRNLTLKTHKRSKRRNGLIFFLGGLFGLLVAAFFANQQDVVNLNGLIDMNFYESLLDIIPSGIVKEAKDLQQHERDATNYDSFSVGLHLQSQGVRALHPVIMVPGVISTGLESWGTEPGSRQYFRKRLWGSWSMMRALIMDKASWKRHVMLDKVTGLDPPHIKLRAAQGFDAADFFITGYWIWNKILENLATIGYDPLNSFTAAYDWRLSYINLEKRDKYFTRLKSYIELALATSDTKVVLVSHSMGSQVLYFFFQWVEAPGHGNGGPDWVEKHVDSWINISGCMLGALKGYPAVLSGEMKDTAQLNAFAVYGLEKFLAREERAEIFRAMPGISSMLPIGGNAIWGNKTWAPDDLPGQVVSFGTFINFKESNSTQSPGNLTVEESLKYLLTNSDSWYQDQIHNSYSHGVAHTTAEIEDNRKDPRKWINPLETRLPLAPHLKIYCFYGIGKPTERSYFYREEPQASALNVTIDTGFSKGEVDHGVVLAEGDGTVSLLSTGYMCAKGWRMKRYNPAGVQIKTYEMPHEPDRFSPRVVNKVLGDHVDILGRSSLNDLVLRVAGGKGDQIEENFVSNIREYAEKVKIYDD